MDRILRLCFLKSWFIPKTYFVDINPNALEVVKKTIEINDLKNVEYYLSDGLSDVPENCCDLIINNPVHFDESRDEKMETSFHR